MKGWNRSLVAGVIAGTLIGAVVGLVLTHKETKVPFRSPTESNASKRYHQGEVRATIQKRFRDLQSCYNAFLEKKPAQSDGKVTMDWSIRPDGKVVRPEVVDSTLRSTEMEQCLSSQIAGWVFPAPPDSKPSYVVHTFSFKRSQPGDPPGNPKGKG